MKRIYLISILLITVLLFYTCKMNDENIITPLTTTTTTTTTTNFLDGKDGYPALSSSTGCHVIYTIGVSTTSLNDCTGLKGMELTTMTTNPNNVYKLTAYFGQIMFVLIIDSLNAGTHTYQYSGGSICNNFTVYFGTVGYFSTALANLLGYANNFNITIDKVESGFIKGSFSGRALTDDLDGYTDITNGKFTAKIE